MANGKRRWFNPPMSATFQVYRVDSSPYFSPSFLQKEREMVELFPSLLYRQRREEVNPAEGPIIWITNTHSRPQDFLSPPDLQATALILHPNSGYDNFPGDFVRGNSFPIILGNEIRLHAVMEYILSALFEHFAAIPRETEWNAQRTWPRALLRDQKVLLIGLGFIGQTLQKVLTPLVRDLHLYDPYQGHPLLPPGPVDVVLVCAGLNPGNHHLINRTFLETLSPRFLLVNAARGKLVNTRDLRQILREKPEAFAYLDVHEQEPYGPLEPHEDSLKNIRFTSHIAGVYQRLEEDTLAFEKKVLGDFLAARKKGPDLTSFLEEYRERNLINRWDEKGQFLR